MTTLYLAEKKLQALDIAKVIGVVGQQNGYIDLKGGDKITWCSGHMLELGEPKTQNEAWGGRWSWTQLPMIPLDFKLDVVTRNSAQFKIIKALLKTVDRVVIATDAGREGELIAREVLLYCKFKGKVDRFWTSTLLPADIAAALASLRTGASMEPLYQAARARQRSDWIYGYTVTRAASLAADVPRECYPVGRIQTPVLALVAHRDEAIKNFKAETYYELEAQVQTASGKSFKMWHAPTEEKRIKDRAEAERRMQLAQAGAADIVLKVDNRPGKESPPMPYKLPALQRDANRLLGLTAKTTLEIAQILYEKKKAITYPRTDCEYLGSGQKEQVESILESLAHRFSSNVDTLRSSGIHLRDSTFDDSQLTDHHAIIPTANNVPLEGLELQVYTLIAFRYLQTLGKDCLFNSTHVSMDANGVPFTASGKAVTFEGWRSLKLKL